MAGELLPAKQFGVVDVDAKVSMDDLLDLKVGEYEKKLHAACKEIEADTECCNKELVRIHDAEQKSYNTVGFEPHVALATETLKCVAEFMKLELKMFDIECRGNLVPHEKRESVVQMNIMILNKADNRHLTRVVVRKLTAEEKKWLKETERLNKTLETNAQYRLQLDKAKANIPLVKRDLKNEVTRKKLEAAGETALLESIDTFEVPTLPKNSLTAK